MITMADVQRVIQKMVAPMQRRVRLMVARAIVELLDDSKKMQELQVSLHADELRDGVERFQNYGFSSVPEVGAEAIVLAVGGNSDHPVAVVVDDRRYRPTDLADGEVTMYTKQNGKRVHAKADGSLLLGTNPTVFVALATPTDSRISALETKLNAHITIFNAHIHPAPGGATSATGTLDTPLSPGSSVAATEVKAK